jgi:hypothetical protein
MTQTNGKKPAPNRDEIIRQMTYQAAIAGYYDTSEEAQQSGMLTISVMDVTGIEPLPEGVTHTFYVLINTTAYYVSRTREGAYSVTPDTERQPSKSENEIREHVLETALSYYGYPGAYQSKEEMIAAMLEDEDEGEDNHPVITEIPQDPDQVLPDGWIPALRSWDVTIGASNCVVGMFESDEENNVFFQVVFS